ESIQSVREGGAGQQVGLRFKDHVTSDGAFVAYARPQFFGLVMAGVLGTDSSATAVSTVLFDHTAVPTSVLPYFPAEQYGGDVIERTTSVKITGVDIEWEAGNPLKVTANFMSGGSTNRYPVGSAMTASRESARPFMYPGASVSIFASATNAFKTVTK